MTQVHFYNESVKEFFQSLQTNIRSKVLRIFHLLETYGSQLEMPHSRTLGHGLFELRIPGTVHVRFLYMFRLDWAIILHGFYKKTWKIPLQDLELGRGRKKLIEGR